MGIDIGKEKHAARAFNFRGIEFDKVIYFENSEYGFKSLQEWVLNIAAIHCKEEVIIGLEPTGHYWLPLHIYLEGNGFKVVTANPHHVKKSKELDDNNPTKCDKKDAKVIAKLVTEGRYCEPNIPNGVYAEIRVAYNHRERIIKNLNRTENSIIRWLDIYFPEFQKVYSDWSAKTAILVLKNIPFPGEIVEKEAQEIVDIWRNNGINRGVGLKKAQGLINAARKSIGITSGKEMAKIQLENLLNQYDLFTEQLNKIEEKIEEILAEIPGAKEMTSIHGVGEMTVAGFLAESGDPDNYQHPKQIIKLAGLNLQEHSSGKHKGQTRITKRGRSRLRALLYRVTLPLVRHNDEFNLLHKYYTTRSQNPLTKKQSLIAISCKLIRVLFALGTKQVEYDGEKMLNDIKRPKDYQQAA
ncbi:MAG: IS110 family transposase [bacterium]